MKFFLLGSSNVQNPDAISLETIQEWQNQGAIVYLGQTSDVRAFIKNSSCVMLPSYYKEGVPRSLLEAMSMAKPIIASDVSGCRECVAPPFQALDKLKIGQNGILTPAKDTQSLAQAILYINNLDSEKLRQMGENGRKIAIERFDIQRVIQAYERAIFEILDSENSEVATRTSKAPKKIAFISNELNSMLNFRASVLQKLQNLNFEIHIIAPLIDEKSTKNAQNLGFVLHHLSVDSKGLNPFKDIKMARSLKQILKNITPHLIFSYTIKPNIYGSFVAKSLQIPIISVVTGLGYVFINENVNLKKRILRKLVIFMQKVAFNRANAVWFLNNDDMKDMVSFGAVSQNKAFLLDSEGVDTQYFTPDLQENCTTCEIDSVMPKTHTNFLLIARMLYSKGVADFSACALALRERERERTDFCVFAIFIANTRQSSQQNFRFFISDSENLHSKLYLPKLFAHTSAKAA